MGRHFADISSGNLVIPPAPGVFKERRGRRPLRKEQAWRITAHFSPCSPKA